MKHNNTDLQDETTFSGGFTMQDIKNWNDHENAENMKATSDRTETSFRPNNDLFYDTDWKAESDYFNYTRVNGKNVKARSLKKGETRLITPEEADQWALEAGLTLDD